jgi:hypothetical protein
LAGQSPSQSAHEPGPRNGESGDMSPIHAPTPLAPANIGPSGIESVANVTLD